MKLLQCWPDGAKSAVVNAAEPSGYCGCRDLTTKEPDDSMIEVAIAAVEAVFDWREYLTENFPGWEKQLEES